ncbi:MAG: hypothetical protein Tsb009_19270 [Planctomycetaceae bacterium]
MSTENGTASLMDVSEMVGNLPNWVEISCKVSKDLCSKRSVELFALFLNQTCDWISECEPVMRQHRQTFVDLSGGKPVNFSGHLFPSAHVAAFEIANKFIESIWHGVVGGIEKQVAANPEKLLEFVEFRDWNKQHSLAKQDGENLLDELLLKRSWDHVEKIVKVFVDDFLGEATSDCSATQALTVSVECERTVLRSIQKERDTNSKSTQGSNGKASAEALLDEVDAEVLRIAAETEKSVDERMRSVLLACTESVGWISRKWAILLGVSDGAIRQTPIWKKLKEKQRKPD